MSFSPQRHNFLTSLHKQPLAMTAAPDDDTLGLNLVYTDPSSLSSSLNGGLGVIKKPKRKTKYDRRREKGKLAKLAKDDEKRKRNGAVGTRATLQQQGKQHSNSSRDVGDDSKVDAGGGSSSLAGIASLLGGSSVKEQKKRKTSSVSQSKSIDTATSTTKPESTAEKEEETAVDVSAAKPNAKVAKEEDTAELAANSIGKEESKSEAALSSSAQSTSLPLAENAKPTVSLAVEDTASSSRRHRVSFYAVFKSLCTSYAHFF